jgi:hypothetical protein
MKNSTAINWGAYRVIKYNNCNPDEIVGYYQSHAAAELARAEYISGKNLKDKGICCSDSNDVKLEEIVIES